MTSMLIRIGPLTVGHAHRLLRRFIEAGSSSEASIRGPGIKVGVSTISILRWTILPLGSIGGFGSRKLFGRPRPGRLWSVSAPRTSAWARAL